MEKFIAWSVVFSPVLSVLGYFIFILLKEEILKRKEAKREKGGICMSCGHQVVNLGAHIDFCLDEKIWRV